jgi:hypothetical protein
MVSPTSCTKNRQFRAKAKLLEENLFLQLNESSPVTNIGAKQQKHLQLTERLRNEKEKGEKLERNESWGAGVMVGKEGKEPGHWRRITTSITGFQKRSKSFWNSVSHIIQCEFSVISNLQPAEGG